MSSTQTRGKKALFLCVILLPLFVTTYAFAQQYQVTAIEPPLGYTASRAMGINNLGHVVGSAALAKAVPELPRVARNRTGRAM